MTALLAFPYRIDSKGGTATTELPAYVEALVRLVLQTDPGERVNRPDFGGGLKALVFLGLDGALASAAETIIRGTLMRWLRDAIAIQTIAVTMQDGEVLVSLTYVVTQSGQAVAQVVREGLPDGPAQRHPVVTAAPPTARLAAR